MKLSFCDKTERNSISTIGSSLTISLKSLALSRKFATLFSVNQTVTKSNFCLLIPKAYVL